MSGITLADAEPPEIVVLDLRMPRMDGDDVCRILRQGLRTRHIPVVMVTDSDGPGLNRETYAAGVQTCIPKPFRKEDLLAAIVAVAVGRPREERSGPR